MKQAYKLFVILVIFLLCANQSFASKFIAEKNKRFSPTQSDMLNYSSESLNQSNKNFEIICNRIAENFKSDKIFIETFNQNKAEYLKYRLLLRDTILPLKQTDLTAYGSNYSIYSESYLQELNNNKINEYKRMVALYCSYNADNQPNCSKKQIKQLFK